MDRVTAGIALVSVKTIQLVENRFGVPYPICGDTLAKEKEARK